MRDYGSPCWRMACAQSVYTRTAIDFGPVSQCCPTGICHAYAPCSHARYALCPALSPPALYNRYSASGVCTAGPCPLRGVGWPSYRGQSLQSGRGLSWRLITSPNNRVHIPTASACAVSPRLSTACPATDSLLLADSVLSTLSGIFFCRLPPFPTLSRHAF